MERYGPDSLNSWVISFACCFINMMMYGMARLSGVLFVASVPRYNVGREKASFPYTFANFMRNTSGPLVGYLGHKFGVRAVTTFGAILGSVGIGLCYFAESIDMITLLWGAVFGYFRDEAGAYDWIFYGIAIISAACSLSWMFAPCIAKCQKRSKLSS